MKLTEAQTYWMTLARETDLCAYPESHACRVLRGCRGLVTETPFPHPFNGRRFVVNAAGRAALGGSREG